MTAWLTKFKGTIRWAAWLVVPTLGLALLLPGRVTITPGSEANAEPSPMRSVVAAPAEVAPIEAAEAVTLAAGFEPIDLEAGPPAALAPAGDDIAELPWPAAVAERQANLGSDSTLDCLIEPYELISLGSPVAGIIDSIHVDRSQPVSAGDVLVQLDSTVEQAVVEVAEARAAMKGELAARKSLLDLRKKKSERAGELFKSQAMSLEIREELETEENVARQELQRAQEEQRLASLELEHARQVLQRRSIRSPITGVVTERLMSAGERVDEDPILRIAQLDPLRVEVVLPSSMFGSIQPGMRTVVIPELNDGEVHIGKVSLVDPVIDAASGTFGLRIDLPNPDGKIPGGLHCQVRFLDE